MNRNLEGSIYGRSSIKSAHFVPIHEQTWLPQAILVSDWSISKNLLEDFFKKSANQKQELSVAAMFVNGLGRNELSQQRTFHRCFLPSFGSFGQTVSEENIKNQPIRNKSRLWWPCLLTDWDEMSYLYRGPSIDASYQVSVHLAKWYQRRFFKICIEITAFWVIFLLTEKIF
jgi:hypothetical protein